jgi:hypothetical protein
VMVTDAYSPISNLRDRIRIFGARVKYQFLFATLKFS